MMKYKILSGYILILLVVTSYCQGDNSKHRLNIKKNLNRFNKHAIKSIKSPDGDIIDCVDINKQPAFDHPSLKNHSIQMRPTYHPQGLPKESKILFLKSLKNDSRSFTQLWHNSGRCPKGTIPIRRTKEEDVLRASSITRYGRNNFTRIPKRKSDYQDLYSTKGHEYAIAYVQGGKYFGAKATINVWKPKIQEWNEFSLSQIWITAGPSDPSFNSIEAGLIVYPQLFGDYNPRLFTFWTRDGYLHTGCYNLNCAGFVHTSNKIALGVSITPISSYQGKQYEITIVMWKDQKTGNWWLQVQNYVVGYFPGVLFPRLQQSANVVERGGEVINLQAGKRHTATQMGSGHFPDEGNLKASYMKNIQVVDGSSKLYIPEKLSLHSDRPDCYNIQLRKRSKDWGSYFFYGGPGRNPKCP